MIDARLKAIADFIRKDSYVCDVGTDHAYLPCYLIKNGITNHCVACDIGEAPLKSARNHIQQYGYENQIETLLSDGLKSVPPEKAQDIVIAGMGGDLIGRILLDAEFTKEKGRRFILQPMTNVDILRDVLYQNGFEILEERPIIDKHHTYTIMLVVYSGKIQQQGQLFLLLGKVIEKKDDQAREYVKRQYLKIQKIADGMKRSVLHMGEAEKYAQLAKEILKAAENSYNEKLDWKK